MDRNLDRNLDAQIDRLTGHLRDEGVAPGRDLWPGISAAIDAAETPSLSRRRQVAGWRIVAVAASVLLLLGMGIVGRGNLSGEAGGPVAMLGGGSAPTEMQLLQLALSELNAAMEADPENGNLSRLVMMIHKSRGELIRSNTRRLLAE